MNDDCLATYLPKSVTTSVVFLTVLFGMDSSQNASESVDDQLIAATRDLETYAINNQFTVHDVPGDGNCLYSSVLYQLQANGLLTTTAQNLIEKWLLLISVNMQRLTCPLCVLLYSLVQPITMILKHLIALMSTLPL